MGEPVVADTAFLRKHADRLSAGLNKKLTRSALDDIDPILRNTSTFIFSATKTLCRDNNIELANGLADSVKSICEAAQSCHEMKKAWDVTMSGIREYYLTTEVTSDPSLGQKFVENLSRMQKHQAVETHEFFKRYQQALGGQARKKGDDDDIEVLAGENDDEDEEARFNCPFSGVLMVVPMINKKCGHHYDQSSVATLLKSNRQGAKCPVRGCKGMVLNEYMEKDESLLFDIEEMKRKKERAAGSKKKRAPKMEEVEDDDVQEKPTRRSSSKKKRVVKENSDDEEE